MKFILSERNVTPDPEKRDEFSISLNDDLKFNGQVIDDEAKKTAVIEAFEKYKPEIVRLGAERVMNSKGGRQKMLSVIYDDDETTYRLLGNTNLEEMVSLYGAIKAELSRILA